MTPQELYEAVEAESRVSVKSELLLELLEKCMYFAANHKTLSSDQPARMQILVSRVLEDSHE